MKWNPEPILAIFKMRLKVYSRYPGWIILDIIAPIIFSVIPFLFAVGIAGSLERAAEIFGNYAGTREFLFYIAIGSAVWGFSTGITWDFGMWLYEELETGTLEQILLTPVKVYELLLGAILYTSFISTINFFLSITIIAILFNCLHYVLSIDFVLALLVVVLGIIPLMGLALFFGALVLKLKEPWAFFNFLTAFMVFICGVFYPITILPPIARAIAVVIPITIAIADARAIIFHLNFIFNPKIDLILLIVYAFLWPLLGMHMYKRVEKELRQRGEITVF